MQVRDGRDGWTHGRVCSSPPMKAPCSASVSPRAAMPSSTTATTSTSTPTTTTCPRGARQVSWADGLVRMASEAADALDPTLRRTGQHGERNVVVLHHDVDPDGTFGPGQLELGPIVPDHVARYLCCDARVQVMTYLQGRLIGINPAERTPNRATRRYLARRDQGCTHPLCGTKLWLARGITSCTGKTTGRRPRKISCSCVRSTTGPSTPGRSRSTAIPRPAPFASSTPGADPSKPRSSPRPATTHPGTGDHRHRRRRRSPHPSANGSPPTCSAGTDRPDSGRPRARVSRRRRRRRT